MRALVQRVARASVSVGGERISGIGRGLLVLLGVGAADDESAADWLADKLVGLRVFENDDGRFDRSVKDVDGEVLVVSQFTLYGDASKGRRPSFSEAARPERAEPLCERVAARLATHGLRVGRGRFGAHMQVELVNDGPVTLMLESPGQAPAAVA